MYNTIFQKEFIRPFTGWCFLLIILIFSAGMPTESRAETLDKRYPGLAAGLLKAAVLELLDEDILLTADEVTIRRSQLTEVIKAQDPRLQSQLEKNLPFLLEQEAVLRVLLNEAAKAGIDAGGRDDNLVIQELFEHRTEKITVSEDEALAFYIDNGEIVGTAPFEQVSEGIRNYLLQDKKQQAVLDYIAGLGTSVNLRINEKWVKKQSRLAMENPVDMARRSGKPTMVEFGASGCVPCDMMQPILDKLRKEYPHKLNVVFIHVGEEQVLAARYGIRSIPVQAFFDADGREVLRHVGFFAQDEVDKQLAAMGVKK